MMKLRFAILVLLVPLCGACSSSAFNSTAPTAVNGTLTATFTSFLAIGGSSSHSFVATQAGNIAVTLTNVTPAAVVGLGVGTPNAGGSGCNVTNSLNASAAVADSTGATTPQLTIPATAGPYCVKVYDSGQLPGIRVEFAVTIAYP